MNTHVDGTQRTRWDKLCDIVKIVLEIGVDIYFLNQDPILRVKDPKVVEGAFSRRPSGYTPLVPVLNKIFQLPPSRRGHDKKLLVFVATDGAPTDENGEENIPDLEHLIRHVRREETTFVSFYR